MNRRLERRELSRGKRHWSCSHTSPRQPTIDAWPLEVGDNGLEWSWLDVFQASDLGLRLDIIPRAKERRWTLVGHQLLDDFQAINVGLVLVERHAKKRQILADKGVVINVSWPTNMFYLDAATIVP